MKLQTDFTDKLLPTQTLTTKQSNLPPNFSVLSPIYDDRGISPGNFGAAKLRNINNFFLDSSIPLTQSKDYSQNKSANRIFSAETPMEKVLNRPSTVARPFTSGFKPHVLKDENYLAGDDLSPKSSVGLPDFKKKISRKTKKEDPFEMVSQYTKTQNEDFLKKMRVLSAISSRAEKIIFPPPSIEKIEDMIEKQQEKEMEINEDEDEEARARRRSMEEIEIYELREGMNKGFELNQYGFQYFYLDMKNKRSPVRISKTTCLVTLMLFKGFMGLVGTQYLKIFYSTKTKKPNRFNSDDFHEGRSLKIYDDKRGKKFAAEHLFLTVFSQTKLKLVAKVEFAKNPKFEIVQVDNAGKDEIVATKRGKNIEKFSIAHLNREILNEDIKRIFQKRREKMLKLCGGVSRIKTNIKTITEFRPEKLVYERECKRVQSAKQITNVLAKKKEIEANMIRKKKDDFERREMIHLIKQKLITEKRNAIKKQERQLKWIKVLNLMVMADFIRRMYLREVIRRKIHGKQLIVYRQVWTEWLVLLRARGSDNHIRMSWDVMASCRLFVTQQKKTIKAHAQKIFIDFLKKTSVLICWNTKLIEYRDQIEKIENSFKNFKKKQKIFLDNLKVLWNRIYFENGQEFRDYIDRHTIREKEKLTANNPKTKELQESILMKHWLEIQNKWKIAVTLYIKHEEKYSRTRDEKLQMRVLKKWNGRLKDKRGTSSFTTEIKPNSDLKEIDLLEEEIDESELFSTRFMKPPILFRLPAIKTIKNMIYKYLDFKKKL